MKYISDKEKYISPAFLAQNCQALGDYWHTNIEEIRPEDHKRRIEAPYFDRIEIKDRINNLLQQWKNVKTLEALNLF